MKTITFILYILALCYFFIGYMRYFFLYTKLKRRTNPYITELINRIDYLEKENAFGASKAAETIAEMSSKIYYFKAKYEKLIHKLGNAEGRLSKSTRDINKLKDEISNLQQKLKP